MRTAFRIGMVVAALALAAWIWSATQTPPPVIPHEVPLPVRVELPTPESSVEQPIASELAESPPQAVSREAVALPVPPPAVAPLPEDGVTRLRVHLLNKEGRLPLKGKRLAALAMEDRTDEERGRHSGNPRRLAPVQTTGEDGCAIFEIPPDTACTIFNLSLELDFKECNVAALEQGEQRELEILVRTLGDLTLFGRLVDAKNSRAIAGGMLEVQRDSASNYSDFDERGEFDGRPSPVVEGPPISAGVDGRFQVQLKSWVRQRFVSATAPGYSRTWFAFESGHTDSSLPLEVRMTRSASVLATVKDEAGAPIAGVRLDFSTSADQIQQASQSDRMYLNSDAHWRAVTDENGKASVLDLPTNVPLKLVLRRTGFEPREEPNPITLEPRERRKLEIRWGSGGTLKGQVLNADGSSLAQQRIWRMASRSQHREPFFFSSFEKPAAVTKTDEQGRFQFSDVPIGAWCVGVAPENFYDETASGIPALAQTIEVKASGEVVELELRVQARLFITGKVLDPSGAPAANCSIFAWVENTRLICDAETNESGEFRLGPLTQGLWKLHASMFYEQAAPALPVDVEAGSDGVVLQLRVGASVAGKVVDAATLEPLDCDVNLSSSDDDKQPWSGRPTTHGNFKFDSLLAGNYWICARDVGGRIGVSAAFKLAEGEVLEDLEIRMRPGAKLKLRLKGGAPYFDYTILVGGSPLLYNQVAKGIAQVEVVPAEKLEVRWSNPESKIAKTQTIQLLVGETKELVWDGKP